MYRLNPVRIRQGVIWAQLPSFGCPLWMEAPVERGEEEEERSVVFVRVCVVQARALWCFPPIWMSQTACVTIILSLFLPLSKHTHKHIHTHMHDSCVWLGKCLWQLIPPTSSFFSCPPHPPASYCYSLPPNLPYALRPTLCNSRESNPIHNSPWAP